jgi:hypothetical protein
LPELKKPLALKDALLSASGNILERRQCIKRMAYVYWNINNLMRVFTLIDEEPGGNLKLILKTSYMYP